MITPDEQLRQLLELVDSTWDAEAEGGLHGTGYVYDAKAMFKVYMVGVLKKLWSRRALHRYLSERPTIVEACGLRGIPDRRTLDRRLGSIARQAEAQVRSLGLVLTLEEVTDAQTVASDGSAFASAGPVWHKKDKQAGRIPARLHGLDRQAEWIVSGYHGWVYGYKAHLSMSVAPTTVRAILSVTVTGASCESAVLTQHLDDLPALTRTLLLDKGYDNSTLLSACQQRGLEALVPLAKKVGKSTSAERRVRADYLASSMGKSRYKQRACSIEPFFATLKHTFQLDPLPVRGKHAVAALITLACYAWNLLVLFNFLNARPLGAVRPLLEML